MKRIILISFCLLNGMFLFPQEKVSKNDIKTLVIFNGKEKLWTKQEKVDSINWSKVDVINCITDSIKCVEKYGEKGKYGVTIVKYCGVKIPNTHEK